jgi:hypothetical protein
LTKQFVRATKTVSLHQFFLSQRIKIELSHFYFNTSSS